MTSHQEDYKDVFSSQHVYEDVVSHWESHDVKPVTEA